MTLDLSRVEYLLGTSPRNQRIAIIGLGSGGFPVLQHLAMSGWQRFILIDPDTHDTGNLVKHPSLRGQIGVSKAELAQSWVIDRIPTAEVEVLPYNVMETDADAWIKNCQLVVNAVDNNGVRHWINDLCVRTSTPMTVGIVHRGGVGGTIFSFRPDGGGCYACLESTAESLHGVPSDSEFPQTPNETEMIYGRRIEGYGAPGLSSDIAMIAALHAQVTTAQLLHQGGDTDAYIAALESNWISVRLREAGQWAWGVIQISLPAIDNCPSCSQGKVAS